MINDVLNPDPSEILEATDMIVPETVQSQSPILVFIAKLLLTVWMLSYITLALAS